MKQKKHKEAAQAYAKAAKDSASGAVVDPELDALLGVTRHEEFSSALATYLHGRALIAAGDKEAGKKLIEIAHWLPLGNEIIRAKLVEDLNKRDWPEMAQKEAETLLATGWYSHYSFGNVLSFLARQSAKQKNFFQAADYYEKCVVGCLRTGATFVEPSAYLLVPESVRMYRVRGLIGKGKIEEALRETNANLEVMPGNIELAIKLVPELEKIGKKKEADEVYNKVRDAWEKLSKDYPDSAFARNSVAWVMANCRRDLDSALKYAQKATETEPANAGYLDTLAEVWFRKGDRDKAIAQMKKCVELDPKNNYFRKQLVRFKEQGFDSPTPEEGDEDE